jgi:hypothetical protein
MGKAEEIGNAASINQIGRVDSGHGGEVYNP